MTRLVLHIELIQNNLGGLVTLIGLDGGLHIPLDDLTVQEQRGVSIATAVKAGVQRTQADFRLGNHGFAGFLEFTIKPLEDQCMLDQCGSG